MWQVVGLKSYPHIYTPRHHYIPFYTTVRHLSIRPNYNKLAYFCIKKAIRYTFYIFQPVDK